VGEQKNMLAQNRKECREFMKYNKPFSAVSAPLRENKKRKASRAESQGRREEEKRNRYFLREHMNQLLKNAAMPTGSAWLWHAESLGQQI